jgi:hypothetical protein
LILSGDIIYSPHFVKAKDIERNVRFQVLTAAKIKLVIFWAVAPCSVVEFTDVSEVLAASIMSSL